MTPELNQPATLSANAAEPKARQVPVPVWLMVLLLVLLYWGMVYFDEYGGWFNPEVYAPYRSYEQVQLYQPPSGGNEAILLGKAKYDVVCSLCHDASGGGKPNQAPPLAGSEWVNGPASRLIRIPLYGLTGPITVKGQQMSFPAPMPPMGTTMTEEELAAVLTYMRQEWGNKAQPITAAQIKAVKAAVGTRPAFTPEEIIQVPE